jgi:hypothetical protein
MGERRATRDAREAQALFERARVLEGELVALEAEHVAACRRIAELEAQLTVSTRAVFIPPPPRPALSPAAPPRRREPRRRRRRRRRR